MAANNEEIDERTRLATEYRFAMLVRSLSLPALPAWRRPLALHPFAALWVELFGLTSVVSIVAAWLSAQTVDWLFFWGAVSCMVLGVFWLGFDAPGNAQATRRARTAAITGDESLTPVAISYLDKMPETPDGLGMPWDSTLRRASSLLLRISSPAVSVVVLPSFYLLFLGLPMVMIYGEKWQQWLAITVIIGLVLLGCTCFSRTRAPFKIRYDAERIWWRTWWGAKRSIRWSEARAFIMVAAPPLIVPGWFRTYAYHHPIYMLDDGNRVLQWTNKLTSDTDSVDEAGQHTGHAQTLCQIVTAHTGLLLRDMSGAVTPLASSDSRNAQDNIASLVGLHRIPATNGVGHAHWQSLVWPLQIVVVCLALIGLGAQLAQSHLYEARLAQAQAMTPLALDSLTSRNAHWRLVDGTQPPETQFTSAGYTTSGDCCDQFLRYYQTFSQATIILSFQGTNDFYLDVDGTEAGQNDLSLYTIPGDSVGFSIYPYGQ